MKHLLWLVSFSLISCSTIELSDAGQHIHITKQFSLADLDAYERLGEVDCNARSNGIHSSKNIIRCRTELKNKAAEMGADIVVIEHEQMGSGSNAFALNNYAVANGCNNCISMVGTAYRKIIIQ